MGASPIQAGKSSLKQHSTTNIQKPMMCFKFHYLQGAVKLSASSCVACFRVLLQNIFSSLSASSSQFLLQVLTLTNSQKLETQIYRLCGVNLPNRRQSDIWKGVPTLDDYSNLLSNTLQVKIICSYFFLFHNSIQQCNVSETWPSGTQWSPYSCSLPGLLPCTGRSQSS